MKRKYEPTLAILMSSVPRYPGPRTLADIVWDAGPSGNLSVQPGWFSYGYGLYQNQ